MRPFLCIAELTEGNHGPDGTCWAIVSVDPSQREDGGCKGIMQSFHHSEEAARQALAAIGKRGR